MAKIGEIDLVSEFDSHEKKIRDYIFEHVNGYYDSGAYDKLKKRMGILTDSYNLKLPGRAGSFSKIAWPILLEAKELLQAILKATIRSRPLITPDPIEGTPKESAIIAGQVITKNFQTTRYHKTLRRIAEYTAGFGSWCQYSEYRLIERSVWQTVNTNIGPRRKMVGDVKGNVYNTPVDPRNYFQDPSEHDPMESFFKGHLSSHLVHELVAEFNNNPDLWIKDNLLDVIQNQKEAKIKQFYEDNQDKRKGRLDAANWFGIIPIPGNEASSTIYMAKVIGNKIVKFQDNPYDENADPYTIFSIRPRLDYWFANTPVEYQRPHEQFTNLAMNMQADNIVNNIMRYFFYQAGSLDTAAINDRARNNGFIPVDLKGNGASQIGQLIQQFSPQDTSTNALDWMMRQIKESREDLSMKPDFRGHGQRGGRPDTTATVATMLQSESDIREQDVLEDFSDGIINTGEINYVMLQQFLPDVFTVTDRPGMPEREVYKPEMMGRYRMVFNSGLQKNKIMQATKIANGIIQLVNLQSRIPALQSLNFIKPVRELIQSLDIGDADDILPEQAPMMPQMAPNQIPFNPQMAVANA